MFRIDSNAKQFQKQLEKIPGALQKATARTLNAISTGAAGEQKKNVNKKMIVRTPYTTKSLRHYKASETKPIEKQNAIVGSVSPYLGIHEKGGTIKAKSPIEAKDGKSQQARKLAVPVPTSALRGADRRKRITAKMRLTKENARQFFVLRPANPVRVLRTPGLFRRVNKKRIVKLRSLSKSSIRVRGNKWHTDAIKKYANEKMTSAVFIREAKKILNSV